jgi:hypothetical protein
MHMNRILRPLLLATALAAVAAPVPRAAAADNVPGKWSENKLLGFRFRPLNEWSEVPPGTDPDAVEIGGFYSDKGKFTSNVRPECGVYAFKRAGMVLDPGASRAVSTPKDGGTPTPPPFGDGDGEKPDGDGDGEKPGGDEPRPPGEGGGRPTEEDFRRMREEFLDANRPKSLEEALNDQRDRRSEFAEMMMKSLDPKKRKDIEQKGWKLPPSVKKVEDKDDPQASITYLDAECPIPLSNGEVKTGRYLGAFIENDEYQVGVLYFLPGSEVKKYAQGVMSSLKSLQWLDPLDVVASRKDLADTLNGANTEDERWVALLKAKLTPGWGHLQTRNYLLLYDKVVEPARVRLVATQIEAIRKDVYEELFPPDRPITAICVVRVCKDKEQYHQYGGPGGSAGYWNSGSKELVFYEDKAAKKDALRVLNHEAFHQYIHYSCGSISPHSWFNEGHGDYFAGFNYSPAAGKFVPAKFSWRADIKSIVGSKRYVPLQRFVTLTQQEYYANAGPNYSQGWGFIWFLRQQKNPEWKQILPVYFDTLKTEISKYVNDWKAQRATAGEPVSEEGPAFIPQEVELNAMDAAVKAAFAGFDEKKWSKLEKEWKDFL